MDLEVLFAEIKSIVEKFIELLKNFFDWKEEQETKPAE